MRITIAAPAKINLRLKVGPREPSGFHDVETILASLHLADTMMLRPGAGAPTLETRFARPLTRMPDLGPPDENLALRAARAFIKRAAVSKGPEIRLVKRIPVGAGLGGGSSDAAAVLRGLDRLHPGVLTATGLMEIGAELGSDVPFFVAGAPLALGTGRGERIRSLSPLPRRFVVLAVPDSPIATAAAYGWLDEDRDTEPKLPESPEHGPARLDWAAIARNAVNDFEASVFRRHPELRTFRDQLLAQGASPALLAGSGSTVFGVFESRAEAREAAAALRDSHPDLRVLVTGTRTR